MSGVNLVFSCMFTTSNDCCNWRTTIVCQDNFHLGRKTGVAPGKWFGEKTQKQVIMLELATCRR